MADDKKIEKAKKNGLEAKVLDDYPFGAVTAFSGREYVKNEWRPVPKGVEEEALVHPFLAIREAGTEKEIPIASKEMLAKQPGTADAALASSHEPEVAAEDVKEETKKHKKK